MLRKLNNKKGGFTLVEIMIVVAIIALLATIALPNFIRARKRAQATQVLEEMRLIDGAKDTWVIETNQKAGAAAPTWATLTPYIKVGTPLQLKTEAEIPAEIGTVDSQPKVKASIVGEFEDVTGGAGTDAEKNFWGIYWQAGA